MAAARSTAFSFSSTRAYAHMDAEVTMVVYTHLSAYTQLICYVTFKIEPWSPFFTCKSNQLVPMPCNSPSIVKERQATQLTHYNSHQWFAEHT